MRTLGHAVLALLFTLPLAAQTAVRFVPAAPGSQTPVVARIGGFWSDSSFPRCADVTVSGSSIFVVARCRPETSLPAVMPWSLDVNLGVLPAGRYEVVVRQDSAAGPELVRAQLLVHDTTAPFEVIPNVGISGDRVRLVSNGAFLCPVITGECDPPSVRFGDQEATVVSASLPNEIVVLAPPAEPLTTVDVTVDFGIDRTRRNAYHYAHSFAPDVAFLEPVLIPVFFAGPGAHGADWQSELTVRNDNDHPLTPVPNPFYSACFPICDTRLQARTSMRITPGNEGLVTGYVFHLPRQAADGVHLNLLVRDLSRQAEALGAEIPVVREHEFYEGSFGIVNVPVDGRYRVDLRLYSIDGAGAMRLVIRSMTSDTPLVTTNLLPLSTTFLLGDLGQQYPQIRGAGAVRIEFIPLNPTIGRFWGFATVTNNETQHVTVISPQ